MAVRRIFFVSSPGRTASNFSLNTSHRSAKTLSKEDDKNFESVSKETVEEVRKPLIKKNTSKAESVLSIKAGKPSASYPEKLAIDPDLMNALIVLHDQNALPDNSGRVGKMERAAQISVTGTVYELTKEEHINALADGNYLNGLTKSVDSSPNSEVVSHIFQRYSRDPMVYLPEIQAHTHSGSTAAPSWQDVGNAAAAKGRFVPKKSMSVGLKGTEGSQVPDAYLFIPTKETKTIDQQLKKNGSNTFNEAFNVYENSKIEPKKGEDIGVTITRMLEEPPLATAAKLGLVVYRYSPNDKVFYRINPPKK